VQYTQRETELDEELSGTTQLGLSPAQAQLLDREGDIKRLAVYYRFKPIGKNIFVVQLSQRSDDLDGAAMSGDANQLQLTHVYVGQRFTTASNIFIAQKDFDAVNPVYGDTREDDKLGLGIVVIDNKIFNGKNWLGQATLAWYDLDSNIDFYKTNTSMISLGAQYRF